MGMTHELEKRWGGTTSSTVVSLVWHGTDYGGVPDQVHKTPSSVGLALRTLRSAHAIFTTESSRLSLLK